MFFSRQTRSKNFQGLIAFFGLLRPLQCHRKISGVFWIPRTGKCFARDPKKEKEREGIDNSQPAR